ncbi:MAG TPA: type II secretion system F family protein [Pirellulaceae bacterium]|nr:type II secretion system F family protein [Pirellulaceae bacterium]
MNEILLDLKDLFAKLAQGDFEAISSAKNSTWLALAAVVVVLLLIVRLLTKTKKPSVKPGKPADDFDLEAALRQPGQNGVFGPFTDALATQLPESKKERGDFNQLLRQAGLYSRTARISIYALRFTALIVPMVIAGAIGLASPPEQMVRILVIGGIVAAALSITPRLYVFFRRRHRLVEIKNGLSDMMDMLSMCLSGGMPLSPSLDHVAHNLSAYPALAEELLILKRQSEVGSLRRALADFADRIDMPQVRQVAGLLARGEQLGNRLSVSLLDQADHFRQTRRQMATMQANKTPVILTLPLMFCFAPAVLILLMSPTLLQLTEFLRPSTGENVLDATQAIGTVTGNDLNIGAVTRQAEGMNANINAQWRRRDLRSNNE